MSIGARTSQKGVALITAIFVLVVLAALGVYMVTISTTQHYTALYGLQGARAYQAAEAGLEWGAYRVINDHVCFTPNPGTFNVNSGAFAGGYSVSVQCSITSHQEKSDIFNIFRLTATGQTQSPTYGQPGFASRTITATVTDVLP